MPMPYSRSSTMTSRPASARARATASPTTPAPTTTHSTVSDITPPRGILRDAAFQLKSAVGRRVRDLRHAMKSIQFHHETFEAAARSRNSLSAVASWRNAGSSRICSTAQRQLAPPVRMLVRGPRQVHLLELAHRVLDLHQDEPAFDRPRYRCTASLRPG